MGYKKAEEILPAELIEILQEYAEGETIYIPRREKKAGWGTLSGTKEKLLTRNKNIYEEFQNGKKVSELAREYFLTDKSVQRILREMKKLDKERCECR